MPMSQAAAKTALGPIAMVAVEQHFPRNQRVIDDEFAYRILPFGARLFVSMMRLHYARNWMFRISERSFPGLWCGIICRKRYIDEKLVECAAQIDALVNLGAGFDTRAYRLPALSDLPLWEVDLEENIEPKRAALRKLLGNVPQRVRLASIDFDRQELGALLESRGFSPTKRTFFVWEAVTQYLTETGIRTTFEFLSKAARGSRLIFTYIRRDFLDGRNLYGHQSLYKRYVVNKIWLFAMEPQRVTLLLERYGWHLVEHLGYQELHERYVRPTGRQLAVTPIERIVSAEKL